MKKIKSFTLAEVLITLVVIGIIAAITVPVVMANHKRTETASKLKKFYSTMLNATKLAELEEGKQTYEMSFGCGGYETKKKQLEDFGILNKIVITKEESMSDNLSYYEKIDIPYKELSSDSPIYYLNDGSLFFVDDCNPTIAYDVNGEKGPNVGGRDIFRFSFLGSDDCDFPGFEDKIPHFNTHPGGWSCLQAEIYIRQNLYARDNLIEKCKTDYSFCTYLIQSDGWEIKDDYPLKI